MDFNIKSRKLRLVNFMENFQKLILDKKTFIRREISSGVEGVVYKSELKHTQFVVKVMNLDEIRDDKAIFLEILKRTPEELYKLFHTEIIFNKPTFIEIVAQTLVNQLVLQKICPNFVLNYYWRFKLNDSLILESFNEYINCCTFEEWTEKLRDIDIWINGLFQIMVGLYSLKKYFNMYHADLHLKNILVYTVKSGGFWKYTIDGLDYFLPNLGFVFVINDFGFSWIPDKLYINWFRDQTLKYITRSGREFYDLAVFLRSVLEDSDVKKPKLFKEFLYDNFTKNDLNYTLSKQYYIVNKFKMTSKYPDINTSFSGDNNTIATKIKSMFYKLYKQPQNNIIDSFSLDIPFNKQKLYSNFHTFINDF